jgi:hypothetical protein
MSALDGRIRHLAREEATALLGVGTPAPDAEHSDRVTALEREVADLRGAVKRAFDRLDAIDHAPGAAEQESKPAARRTRKTAETSE